MRFGRESTKCNAGWRVHEAAPFLIRAARSKGGVRLSRPKVSRQSCSWGLGISGNLEGMKRGNRPYACIPVHFVLTMIFFASNNRLVRSDPGTERRDEYSNRWSLVGNQWQRRIVQLPGGCVRTVTNPSHITLSLSCRQLSETRAAWHLWRSHSPLPSCAQIPWL